MRRKHFLVVFCLAFFLVQADLYPKKVKLGAVFPNFLLLDEKYNLSISGNGFDPFDPETLDFTLQYVSRVKATAHTGKYKNLGNTILENVIFNSSGTVLLGNPRSSNFLTLYVYGTPKISRLQPNVTSSNGGGLIQIAGTGLFYSNFIAVLLEYNNYSQTVPGSYDFKTDTIVFTSPFFEVPSYINRDVLQLDAEFLVSISLTLDGVKFIPLSERLVVQALRTWRVGYIFGGSVTAVGVSYDQNLARVTVDSDFKGAVQSDFQQNVLDSDAFNATLFFCKEDYDLIFGGSGGFLSAMKNASYTDSCRYVNGDKRNTTLPKTTYMVINSADSFSTPTMVSAYATVQELFYLSGLIAGLQLKKISSNNVCFIADFNTSVSRRYTNAFVIGCRQTNPSCRLVILWTGQTQNSYIDEQAAQFLWFQEGCRIIAQNTVSVSPSTVFANGGPSAASIAMFQQRNNLIKEQVLNYTGQLPNIGCSFGFLVDAGEFLGNSVLTSIIIQWTPIIEYFLKTLMHGEWPQTTSYIPGISSGAIHLAPYSSLVGTAARDLVQFETEKLLSGSCNLWCGHLVMEDGSPVPARQPNFTYLGGEHEYIFYNRNTNAFCEQQEVDRGECCLNPGIGMSGMWYQLQGTYAPKQCLDPVKCVFGTLVHRVNEAGFVEGWYTAPPENPPLPPKMKVICNSNLPSNTLELFLDLSESISENGNAIQSYKVEWDTMNGFQSSERDCTTGTLCEILVPSMLSSCATSLGDGETCMLGTIYGVESGTTFFVRVFAFDGFRYSSASTAQSCMTTYTRTLLKPTKSFKYVFGTIAVIGMLLGIVNSIFLLLYRKHEVIVSANCLFCIIVSLGISSAYAVVICYTVEVTHTVCAISPWIAVLSFCFMFTPIFAKARRIHAYLSNTSDSFRRVAISDFQLLKEIATYLCSKCLLLALLTKYYPSEITKTDSKDSPYYYTEQCISAGSQFSIFFISIPTSFSSATLVPIALILNLMAMMSYGAYLCFKVRNAPSNFNESRNVAFCMYNMFLTVIVLFPLAALVDQPLVKSIIECLAMIWMLTASFVALFLPMWLRIFRPVRTFAESIEQGFENVPSEHGSSYGGNSPNLPSLVDSSSRSKKKYKVSPLRKPTPSTCVDGPPTGRLTAVEGRTVNADNSRCKTLPQRPIRASSL